jgi:hypothetical protein
MTWVIQCTVLGDLSHSIQLKKQLQNALVSPSESSPSIGFVGDHGLLALKGMPFETCNELTNCLVMAVSPYSHSTALLAGLSGAKLFAELVDRRRGLSFLGETDILAPSIWICGSVSLHLGSAYFCRSRREANFPGSKVETRGEVAGWKSTVQQQRNSP